MSAFSSPPIRCSRPGRSGDRPRAGEGLRVAEVRVEALLLRAIRDADPGQVGRVRDQPRLGAVGEEGVAQEGDRGHVLQGDPPGLDRVVEALGRRRRGDDRERRVRVPPEQDLEEVALLGLRGQAGGRAAPLDVDQDERQLDHDREPEGLALQRDAGAGGAGDPERAAVRRADRRADRRDLVLRLEGLDPEVLVAGELVEDVRGRGDRVRPVEERPVGELRGGHEPEGGRLVAGDVPVAAGLETGRRDDEALVEHLGRLAERVAGLERPLVALGDHRPLGELLVDPADRGLHAPLVEPEHHAEGEEVLRQVDLLVRELETLEGPRVECRDRDREDLPRGQRPVSQRIRRVPDLAEVAGGEGVLVDDQGAAGRAARRGSP